MIIFRKISFYIAALSLIAMCALVYKMGISEPKPPPVVAPPVKPTQNGIGAAGLVEAIHETTSIGTPMAGIVAKVYVQVWDRVTIGQPLFQLDDRDLRSQMTVQRANVAVADAQLKRINEQYRVIKSVTDPRAVSQSEVTGRGDEVSIAQAQLSAAQALLGATQNALDRLTVRSPLDGTVLQRNINEGEFVSPQATTAPLLLGNIDEVQVRADVDEQIASRVHEGKNAVGYIKGESNHPIQLQFVRIEPFVVPKRSLTGFANERVDTRVLQVIFKFPNNVDGKVYVGQQMDLFIDE